MVQRGSTARSLRRPAACEPGQPVMQQAGKKNRGHAPVHGGDRIGSGYWSRSFSSSLTIGTSHGASMPTRTCAPFTSRMVMAIFSPIRVAG